MLPNFVIPANEIPDSSLAVDHVHIALDVNIFVLERPPEPFYVYIVQRTTLAIHGQLGGTLFILEQGREFIRRILPFPKKQKKLKKDMKH